MCSKHRNLVQRPARGDHLVRQRTFGHQLPPMSVVIHLYDIITDIITILIHPCSCNQRCEPLTRIDQPQEICHNCPAKLHMRALLAELERGMIVERTKGGQQAVRRRGEKFGTKQLLSAAQIEHARQLLMRNGKAPREVARPAKSHPRHIVADTAKLSHLSSVTMYLTIAFAVCFFLGRRLCALPLREV